MPRRSSGFLWSLTSTAVVGGLGLLCIVIAARGLGPSDYVDFAVVWGIFFGIGGVFAGMQQEITRSVAHPEEWRRELLIRWTLVLSIPVCLAGGLVASGTKDIASPANGVIVAVGLLGLGGLTHLSGSLAALSRWRALSYSLMVDALVRTCAVVAVVVIGSRDELALAIVAGALSWPILLLGREWRTAFLVRSPSATRAFLTRASGAMIAAGCGALLLAGFPLIADVVRTDLGGPEVGASLAGVALIRSGLLMVVFGLRPVILQRFLTASPSARAQASWIVRVVAGFGGLYVLAVGLFGPWLLAFVLTSDFRLDRPTCAGFAVGTAGLMTLVLTGLALIARARPYAAAVGWVAALVATVVLLASVNAATQSVLVAATAAPWIGVLGHLAVWSDRRATH